MNKESNEIFVDGVDSVQLINGAYRFNLVTVESISEKEGKKPDINTKLKLIMTPQALATTNSHFTKVLEEVEKKFNGEESKKSNSKSEVE